MAVLMKKVISFGHPPGRQALNLAILTKITMVLKLDGNSEKDAHACGKIVILIY